ncbi:hypothetical protein [Sulfuracidifex tepidarius]|uniref:Uncharacterized protein n=1 Tax=Sulfuracidifex tepidarius TaxID=1294262 RepID=A0A510DZ25_9CREN|nr:hypothetical protein [Sulfuracidifex tepidarius]BBG25471.1 hypothetical protein IC006_2807 [Sulfuracidifex tepidarius]BBG28265.1 hypothetical protein IC007_2821 [Sulfuracidifex tepidarius]
MELVEIAKKLKELGTEYEENLDLLLNELNKHVTTECVALDMEDSLFPIYSISNVKAEAILALPYKCMGRIGFLIINERGLFFEDMQGQSKLLKGFKDEKI